MKRAHVILLCCVVMAGLATGNLFAGEAEKNAIKAAESWLAAVDEGEYAKSWEQSAALFKSAVTKEQWEQALKASRKPIGDMLSRKVKSAQFASSLPGAPDGEYVVILFTTSFSKKKNAVETVTPMKDADGQWRVSGYYVK